LPKDTTSELLVVVLSDLFRRMGEQRNSMEAQQLGHAQRSGPEVKNGRCSAKDGALERLGCRTAQEEVSQILQSVHRRCIKNSPSFLSCAVKTTKDCDKARMWDSQGGGESYPAEGVCRR